MAKQKQLNQTELVDLGVRIAMLKQAIKEMEAQFKSEIKNRAVMRSIKYNELDQLELLR